MELIHELITVTWAIAPIMAGMAIASAGAGIAKDLTADRRNRKAMNMQIDGSKQMAEFNRQQQMKLWEDTNYSAQMEQMRKAGLNPGLMYEMGGPGGQTGALGGTVSAPDMEGYGGGTQGGIAQAMGMMMQKAQIENINADTLVKKKDAGIKGNEEESGGIDLEIKKRLGVEALERKAQIEMQSANSTEMKNIREINAWMDEAFSDSDAMNEDGSIEIRSDKFGAYATGQNSMARKLIRAGIEKTIEELNNLKKTGSNLDKQGQIMNAEKIIKDFEAGLTDVGLNGVSGQILTKLLHIIFSK